MKHLLLTLSLLWVSLIGISQTPNFFRANQFAVGEMVNEKAVWDKPMAVNILIKVENNNLIVYSQELQEYHIVSLLTETETVSVWTCMDKNGTTCRVYLGYNPEADQIAVTVEYNDYIWMYICTKE